MAHENTVPMRGATTGNTRAIANLGKVNQGRALRAAIETPAKFADNPSDFEGFSSGDYLVRIFATGCPLWHSYSPATRAHWQATHTKRGIVHEFAHAAEGGDETPCTGTNHAPCGATAPNQRDGVRRWRGEGDSESLTLVPAAYRKAASENAAKYVALLRTTYNVDTAAALATPSIAMARDAGLIDGEGNAK